MPLREGSSGKLIQGTETGQVLTWNQDEQDWSAQTPSGGSVTRQSVQLWVDPQTTVPEPQRDGSISAPFATLGAALTAMATIKATTLQPGVIWLGNGDYAGETWAWGPVGSDPAQNALALLGQGGVYGLGVGTITGAVDLANTLTLAIAGVGLPDGAQPNRIGIESVDMSGGGYAALQVLDSVLNGLGVEGFGIAVVRDSAILGELILSGARHEFVDCAIEANEGSDFSISSGETVFVGCVGFDDGEPFAIGSDVRFENCRGFGVDIALGSGVHAVFSGCAFTANQTVTGDATTIVELVDCDGDPDNGGVAVTAGELRMSRCNWGANIAGLVSIWIDQATFNRNFEGGFSATTPELTITDLVSSVPVAWDATAPQVIEVLAAGHAPGIYLVTFWGFNLLAATTGNATPELAFTTFGGAPVSVGLVDWEPLNLDSADTPMQEDGKLTTAVAVSDGSAPIVLTLTPVGVTGTASANLYVSAVLQASVVA